MTNLRFIKRTVEESEGILYNETILQILVQTTILEDHHELGLQTKIIQEWVDVPVVDKRTMRFRGE